MKTSTVIIIIFVILLIIGGAVAYFLIEKPAKEKANKPKDYNNLSIDAFADGEQIIANYTIFDANGSFYAKGTTLQNDYILQQVEANQSYDLMVESPEIYTRKMHMNPTMLSPVRVDLQSNKIGDVQISHNGTFWQDNPLNLTINVTKMIKNPVICFRWSINLIDVSIDGLTLFDQQVPSRLITDKCYYLNSPINNTFLTFPLSYEKFGAWHDDSIKVILFDGDITSYSPYHVVYENQKNEDIFMKDVIYVIN